MSARDPSETSRPGSGSSIGPVPPPLPIARRLNRNALTVAAVLMGMTVLVAIVTLKAKPPRGGTVAGDTTATAPHPGQPSFLDRPVRPDTAARPAPRALDSVPPMPAELGHHEFSTEPIPAYVPPAPPPTSDGAGSDAPADEAFRRALRSPVPIASSQLAAPIGGSIASPAGGSGGAVAIDSADSLARPPLLAREGTLTSGRGTTRPRSEPSETPYRLRAGTLIPAVLLTAANSDLPGTVVAQVARNVYDSRTLRILLIPQGATLIGRYASASAIGQTRLVVTWTQLTLPNGGALALPSLDAVDAAGTRGLPGHVDNHTERLFGTALLTSIISAGVQLSQPQTSGGIYAAPSAQQVAAAAIGQELSSVGLEVLRKNLAIASTITLPAGMPLNVLVSSDLDLPGPYVAR